MESKESPKEAGGMVHPDFQPSPDTDIVVISSDNTKFYFRMLLLRAHSQVFDNMLESAIDTSGEVKLNDTSTEDISLMLDLFSPEKTKVLVITSVSLALQILSLAIKFEAGNFFTIVFTYLLASASVPAKEFFKIPSAPKEFVQTVLMCYACGHYFSENSLREKALVALHLLEDSVALVVLDEALNMMKNFPIFEPGLRKYNEGAHMRSLMFQQATKDCERICDPSLHGCTSKEVRQAESFINSRQRQICGEELGIEEFPNLQSIKDCTSFESGNNTFKVPGARLPRNLCEQNVLKAVAELRKLRPLLEDLNVV
ncbi:hypothetical protein T439DRAFT_330063 [Meredithblackwellia eburnea MCA 4105]